MEEFIQMPIPVSKFALVCALLGGGSTLVQASDAFDEGGRSTAGNPPPPPSSSTSTATTGTGSELGTAAQADPAPLASADGGENAGKRDAAGTLFDPARHTGTIVKSGLWRMKTGLSRGPGEGEDSPTYVKPGEAGSPPPPPPGAAPADEDDEFAQFATQAAAPTAPVARTWTDADLSALCNQAAQKDGNPERVKAAIAKYVPTGAVQHSRNIPAEQRETFAKEVETTVGIQFGG